MFVGCTYTHTILWLGNVEVFWMPFHATKWATRVHTAKSEGAGSPAPHSCRHRSGQRGVCATRMALTRKKTSTVRSAGRVGGRSQRFSLYLLGSDAAPQRCDLPPIIPTDLTVAKKSDRSGRGGTSAECRRLFCLKFLQISALSSAMGRHSALADVLAEKPFTPCAERVQEFGGRPYS